MHVYLLSTGPEQAAGGESAQDALLSPEEQTRLAALEPGIRARCGQPDYVLTGKLPALKQSSQIFSEKFLCVEFLQHEPCLDEDGADTDAIKLLNKFIGKERVFVLVREQAWLRLAKLLAGDDAVPEGFSPGRFTLAEIYIKGFPAPAAGKLNWIMAEADILAATQSET